MRKNKQILLIIGMLFVSISAKTQVSDSVYFQRLYHTCKVWGHVKYYHTEVANGSVNWDDTLLNYLPGIKTAPNNEAFNDTLLQLLRSAGEMAIIDTTMPPTTDSICNFDFTWIEDTIFSPEIKSILDTIWARFKPQDNIYLLEEYYGPKFTFDNDSSYYMGSFYPNEELRILAVFRYWNIIDKFFPYKYMMDNDWSNSLKKFLPDIIEADNELEYSLAFRRFTVSIDDSHGFFSNNTYWIGDSHTPFLLRYIEDQTIITKAKEGSVFEVGDVIEEIDNIEVNTLRDSLMVYSYGSNIDYKNLNINSFIQKGPSGLITAIVNNGEESIEKSSTRNNTNEQLLTQIDKPAWYDTINDAGCKFRVINMDALMENDIPELFNTANSVDGLIFDIRNYPNGTIWTIIEYLFPSPLTFSMFKFPDINVPGRFYWSDFPIGIENDNPYEGKISILFDERTISQAEYSVMALEMFPDAVKIGSRTAGADGNITRVFLPGKIQTIFSFFGVYYPDGSPTQRVGITPDFEVRPTIDGIRNGNDEVLDFAMNCEFASIEEPVEVKSTSELQLYPNPANNTLNFNIINAQAQTVEIINLQGKTILNEKVNSKSGSVDVSKITNGLHIIKVNTNQGVITQTFLKN